MTVVYPGIGSTYVKMHEASGLLVQYTKDPSRFQHDTYVQPVPTSKMIGLWAQIDTDEAVRVVSPDDYTWRDGDEAPLGKNSPLEWNEYIAVRRAFPFRLGALTTHQASFDILLSHANIAAQKAMTARMVALRSLVSTSGSWTQIDGSTAHIDTAANVGGGVWLASSTTNKYIQKTFNEVANDILKASNGTVGPGDIYCVLDPKGAEIIAESPEFQAWYQGTPAAPDMVAQASPYNQLMGLPNRLWGVNIVIDTTVFTATQEGATVSKQYLFEDIGSLNGCAMFCSRPRGIASPTPEAPSFSTLSYLFYEDSEVGQQEMEIRLKYDDDNERYLGRVVTNGAYKITAPETGYFVTNIDS
jgi:hypothetical protein